MEKQTKYRIIFIISMIIIFGIIVLTNSVLADYPGESKTFDNELDGTNINCSIIINETYSIPLYTNATLEEIYIEYPDDTPPGNFSMKCILTKYVPDETSSNGGSSHSSGSISGWSAKCGYNKECLYGSDNETYEVVVVEDNQEENVGEIIGQVEEKGSSGWVWILLGIVLVVGIIGVVIYLYFKEFIF